jgi:transmembrane sensor
VSDSSTPSISYTGLQRHEAAEWFVVIHGEEVPSAESLQAWLRWMDQDEGNRQAFELVAQAWHGTPGSAALAMPSSEELKADTYDGEQPIAEWLAKSNAPSAHSTTVRRNAFRRVTRAHRLRWLAAATLAAVILGSLLMNRYLSVHGSRSDEFMTRTGEQIEMTLADGSRVWLGPKSTLRVGFTEERREIQLNSGEAFFSVKKDHSRPFVVRSTGGDITAVGTAFNVRAVADHVTVSVSEGVVTVAPKTQLLALKPDSVRVGSGQQLTFAAEESIKALAIALSPTPVERSRWRDGILVYRDEPLRDVVMDVARYSDKELQFSGGAIGDLHYSGVVYMGAVDEWTSALPESFPVKIVSDGNREIILAR